MKKCYYAENKSSHYVSLQVESNDSFHALEMHVKQTIQSRKLSSKNETPQVSPVSLSTKIAQTSSTEIVSNAELLPVSNKSTSNGVKY